MCHNTQSHIQVPTCVTTSALSSPGRNVQSKQAAKQE